MGHRRIAIAALFGLGLGLALVGCKGDDGGGGSGGSGGSAPEDAPVVLPPNGNGQSCQQSTGGTCDDQAAIQEYADCVVQTCDAEYEQCFGADYLNGTFGGDCKDLMDCASACQDCDEACIQACSDQHFTAACKSCITGPILDCVVDALTSGTCSLPCGPSNSGGVCDDLKACCDSLTGDDQTNCQSTYDQVKIGGDAACQNVLSTYQQSQKCQ